MPCSFVVDRLYDTEKGDFPSPRPSFSRLAMSVFEIIRSRVGVRDSISNIGWLSGDRFLRMFGAVLVGTLVARYLGPAQFGLLNYGIAIYGMFNVISSLGLDQLVVRDMALDESGEPVILGSSFLLKAVASVLTTIAAIIAADLLEPGNRVLIEIVALMSIASISQALDVIDFFFQARTRSRYAVVPRNVAFVLGSVARVIAVFARLDLLVFAWIAALEVLLGEIGLAISYFRFRRGLPRWSWHLGWAKSILMESWPLLVSTLMVTVYMRSDQILLGRLGTKAIVGQYTAAIRLSEIWYSIPVIICASVMPRLLKTRELNPARYYKRLQRLYEGMIFISLILAVITQFVAPLVIRILYGSDFAPAAGILRVHIWTGIFVFIGSVSGIQFVQEKLTVSTMQRTVMGAILNLILNLLWIPRWGGMGSAMATLVAQSLASYFGDAFDTRTRHIFRMKTRAYLRFWMLPGLVFKGTID
jgi:PST family polysaccharide transporter